MNDEKFKKLLVQLEKLHPKYIDLSLSRILKLLEKLNNPHLNLPKTIHIAGTNGKGSTLSFIFQILIEHKYTVHCYISPHLESMEERYILSNKKISKKKLYSTLKYIQKINNNESITFFEITTVAAFYLFNKLKADFLILETGLGGKFDATNVIKESIIDIITPISLDHKEFLGKNLKKIAIEKLGIIKPNSSIIIGKQKNIVAEHIQKIIKNKRKKLFYNKDYKIKKIEKNNFLFNHKKSNIRYNKPSLRGKHQLENSATAIMAAHEIRKFGYKINSQIINKALINAKWPGRLEKGMLENIPVYIDGAHNIGGAEQLSFFLNERKTSTWIILGMLNNKDLFSFLKKLKNNISGILALKIPGEIKSYNTSEIAMCCKKLKINCIESKNIRMCNKLLLTKIKPQQILITGSLYFIGKIRKLYI